MHKRTPIIAGGVVVALIGFTLAGPDPEAPAPAPSATPTASATPTPSPATPTPSEAASEAPTAPQPTTEGLPVPAPPTERNSDGHIEATVARVVDGDTLKVTVDGTTTTVRVIGIDTPETVHPSKPVQCYGPEASAEAKRLLEGTTVRLVPDPTQGTEDRYGRALAYVDLNGLDYGRHMIEAGYAEEATYDGAYARRDAYLAAEDLAKAAGAGQWSACQ